MTWGTADEAVEAAAGAVRRFGRFPSVPVDPDATAIDIRTVRTDGPAASRRRRFARAPAVRAHDLMALHERIRDALDRGQHDRVIVADRSGTVGGWATAILAYAEGHPIRRLTVSLHADGPLAGGRVELHWGAEAVHRDNLDIHADQLARLRGHFAPDALVTLHARAAGEDRALLLGLAGILGVPVQGPLAQVPATRWLARFARCFPDGGGCEVHLEIN